MLCHRAVHRHFEGQWPEPKKGALSGCVLNTNYPVVTNTQLKEKTAHSVIISDFIVDVLIRVGSPSLSEPASALSSMEVGESGVS